MEKRLLNILVIFLAVLIFLAGIFVIWFYFQNQVNECISNPLIYGAKQMTEAYGYEFQGRGFFVVPINYNIPIILFNSTSITVQSEG